MLLRHAPYTLELRYPFGIASHTRTSTPATLTTFEHEGITGYGEAAMPPYLGESQATAAAFLDRAAAHLATVRDPFQLEEILPALDALAPGNTAAKAAVSEGIRRIEDVAAGRVTGLTEEQYRTAVR
jgi:L-alanine-DL-glutamate epimerase-like enolase superfamily enzyme